MSDSTMQDFEAISQAVAGATAAAAQHVVTVNGRRRRPASGVIWSADGLVVTANHVLERDEDITVVLPDGQQERAELVGRDPGLDLALLRVRRNDLNPARWASGATLHVGNLALALARPNGEIQAALGVITSVAGPWRHPGGGRFDLYIQADITMYPGFSGGPLLTGSGGFAGINSSALARGVSLSIPASSVHKSVEALVAHGRIPRAYLGVGVQAVKLQATDLTGRDQERALMLMSVEDNTPASQAGLLQGDILLALDGQELGDVDALQSLLAETSAPVTVSASVLRGGSILTLEVALTAR